MELSFRSVNWIKKKIDKNPLEVDGISIVSYQISRGSSSSSTFLHGKLLYKDNRNRAREANVRFGLFGEEEDLAKNIFINSTNISHRTLLKVWCVMYCDTLQSWLICYNGFTDTLEDYLSGGNATQPFDISSNVHLIDSWWSNTIRNLLIVVNDIHSKKLLHRGLSDIDNYVVVGNEVKLLNIRSSDSLERIVHNNSACQRARKRDMSDLKQLLRTLLIFQNSPDIQNTPDKISLQRNITGERDLFLDFMDSYTSCPLTRICNHPFLMSSNERLSIFLKIGMGDYGRLASLQQSYAGWKNKPMDNVLQIIYTRPGSNYNRFDDVRELVHLIRNVTTHGQSNSPIMYDSALMKLCPKFVIRVYELLSFLGRQNY